MASYGDLTEGEQAHFDEYSNLVRSVIGPGSTTRNASASARRAAWLEDRRAQLWHDLNDEPVDHEENEANKRAQRYEFLKDSNLNSGSPKHEVRLPCPGGATDLEKVYVEEREVYLSFGSTTDEQKARKQANVDWLVTQRKKVWHLGEDEGWDVNNRDERYDALCIATHHGSAYEYWDEDHNKWGEPYAPAESSQPAPADLRLARRSRRRLGEPDGLQQGPPGTVAVAEPGLRRRRGSVVRVLQCVLGVGQRDHRVRDGRRLQQRATREAGAGHLQGLDE